MKYPKPLMSITELEKEMGFSRDYLERIVHHPLAKMFAQKMNDAKNSKYKIDTEEFEKLRKKGQLK